MVDRATGGLVPQSDALVPAARKILGDAVSSELNLCQIEVATDVCTELSEVRTQLRGFRSGLAAAGRPLGLAPAACGTHPFDSWRRQRVDDRVERYRRMERVYQIVAREQVICGCHVHVGIDDRDLAVEIMNRVRPWLPPLLALSANSPYWEGMDTGYASYRLQVWQRWPTSGMPPNLRSAAEYDRFVAELEQIEAIEDSTFLYWYVRPSSRYPTLEFRPCDVCLTVEDTVVIAGLIRALAWTCGEEIEQNRPPAIVRREMLDAAMWRAARFGVEESLVVATSDGTAPARQVIADLLAFARPGLEAHGDLEDVTNGVQEILERGSGAVRQRSAYRGAEPEGVLARIIDETVAG